MSENVEPLEIENGDAGEDVKRQRSKIGRCGIHCFVLVMVGSVRRG